MHAGGRARPAGAWAARLPRRTRRAAVSGASAAVGRASGCGCLRRAHPKERPRGLAARPGASGADARAQDSGYRGLVALGIGAVGGTAVAAFSSADAARLASRADDAAAIKARPAARAGSSTAPAPGPRRSRAPRDLARNVSRAPAAGAGRRARRRGARPPGELSGAGCGCRARWPCLPPRRARRGRGAGGARAAAAAGGRERAGRAALGRRRARAAPRAAQRAPADRAGAGARVGGGRRRRRARRVAGGRLRLGGRPAARAQGAARGRAAARAAHVRGFAPSPSRYAVRMQQSAQK